MNTASRKMNVEEAVDFLNQLPDDSQELNFDLDKSQELSVDPVIDIPMNSFTQVQDENNNKINQDENNNNIDIESAQVGSAFVTIQIMEITPNDSYVKSSSPQRVFAYEMLDQANVLSEDSLIEPNVPILNHSPQEPDANNNEDINSDFVAVPFYMDGTDNTHVETNENNEQNGTDIADNTIIETNTDNEHNIADDLNAVYETDTDVEETDNTNSRSRKRKRNEGQWKRNVTKRLRQSGQEYRDRKGNMKRARELKAAGDCGGTCKYRCSQKISSAERKEMFNEFWRYTDTEKQAHYMRTTEKNRTKRKTLKDKASRRKYSYSYFLIKDTDKIRVCKAFYLHTLDISQRRIEWGHAKAEKEKHEYKRGKHIKYQVADDEIEIIKEHINSFPRIPSHYCRKSSKEEYLEPTLSVLKMHSLYVESCKEKGIGYQKVNVYRQVFDNEFNLAFYVPKKDRCDSCEEYKALTQNGFNDSKSEAKYLAHIKDKEETHTERDNDRKNETKVVVAFDLENVITCPRANISNFFYKRKLNVYNLTAHCSVNKKAYNAIWCESIAGRGANEIASALVKILCEIVDDIPGMTHLTLWSDSCVPQNRNSVMSFALKKFLVEHPTLRAITQKFCAPGHSSIQEVDNIHRHIEKALKVAEIYSPVSLLRVMLNVRPNTSRVIQLKPENFVNYQKGAGYLSFSVLPYTKVKLIHYDADKPFHIEFKTSYSQECFTEVNIRGQTTRSCKYDKALLPSVFTMKRTAGVSKEKKRRLEEYDKIHAYTGCRVFQNVCVKRHWSQMIHSDKEPW